MPVIMTQFQFRKLFENQEHPFTEDGLNKIYAHLEDCGDEVEVDALSICVGFDEGKAVDVLEHCDFPDLQTMAKITFALETSDGNIVYNKDY